jgi:hypothetical protein
MGNPMSTARIWILAACVFLCSLSDALGALAHRYSFTTNANDSVGTAHGTVIDAGAPTAVFAGGQLDLSANTGQGSNAITEDAFVDLPNGLISGIASGGVSGAFSMEVWATVAETHTWQRFIDVGTADGGENMSNGGGASPYIYIAANSGRFMDGVSTETHAPAGPLREVGQTGPLPTGVQVHIVGTYDANETTAARPNGTFRLYRDGILLGTGALPPNLPLNTFTNNNNWLGRSQWNDPVFDGQFNEVRLYSHALTAAEVGTNNFSGPDSLQSLLSLTVNTNSGAVSLTNNATTALVADFYRMSSAGNALSFAGWNSLDDQNVDAVDGPDAGTAAGDSPTEGWDQGGGSGAGQLLEYFLGETGSTIGPGETLALGNAFNPAVFGAGNNGDVQFSLGLLNGLEILGSVTYVAGPGGLPGDYNNDGAVNAADYVVWRKNIGTQDGYNLWRTNFGRTSGSGSLAGGAIPEPSLLAMLIAVAAAGFMRRSP